MFEEVKAHVGRHKVAYSFGAGIIVIGAIGVTVVVITRNSSQVGLINMASFSLGNKPVVNVITVVEREGRGHTGYPVRCIETGEEFFTQRLASLAKGISEVNLSKQLKGLRKWEDDVFHFVRTSLPVAA